MDLQLRQGSLKVIDHKRSSQLKESEQKKIAETECSNLEDDEILTLTDFTGQKFIKTMFIRKPNKPEKPPSLNDVTLPMVHLEAEVTRREAGGRKGENTSSAISQM